MCEFRQPSELKEILSYLPITEKPTSKSELLEACRDVIKYSVKTGKYVGAESVMPFKESSFLR